MADKSISSQELREFKAKTEREIEEIHKSNCSCCEEPATGADCCDKCEYGQRLGDRYWILRMMDSEYGS